MAKILTQGIFNGAIDGIGVIFKGTPDAPSYLQSSASVFQNRFAMGDRSNADFSFWWYWSEADWGEGFQEEFYTQGETGYFKSGNNIDVIREPGKIQCLSQPSLIKTIGGLGAGAVVGDAIGWGDKLLIGFSRTAGTATLCTLTTDGTFTNLNLPGQCGPGINQMDVFENYAYIACSTAITGTALVRIDSNGTYTALGETLANKTSCRGACVINDIFYWAYKSATGVGDRLKSSTDGTISVACVNFTGSSRKISESNMVSYNSSLYYLIQEGNKIELWQYAYNVGNKIYTWDYLSNPKLSIYLSYLMIIGQVGGRIVHFLFDGYRMKTSFEQLASTPNVTYGKYKEIFGVGYCGGMSCKLSADGNLVYYPSYNFMTNGTQSQPIASFNGYLYLSNAINSDGSFVIERVDPIAGASYATAGSHFLTTPIHTGFIPDVDKIYHDCIIRMDTLGTNEKITVEYSVDPHTTDASATWVTLGSADYAVDGAITSKRIPFPTSPVITKQMKRRVHLTPSSTTTPKVQDVVFRYLPMTYYPYEWQITVNASDEIELINGQLDTKTGRQIRNNLQMSLWGNQIVDWQDIDYFTTKLTTAMTLTGTIAKVLDTTNAPETGRIIVDNEEIFYTGKTPTAFNPVSRGERGTPATTHASATIVDNAYRVLLTDIKNQVPVLNQGKKIEYLTTINFRENV